MADLKMGVVETRFAELIWNNEPISSGDLVRLCAKELDWKKSTTYTVLKKLCERGIFANEDGTVRSLYNKRDFYAAQSRQYVEDTFEGSLPAFMAAFSSGRRLTEEELKEIRDLLDTWQKAGQTQ
ncbi:MAG: BlaI/MecI/CopY family transcriptional regulator [Lachnospiraceae bacterium]|nr:BlaI/MecI/CopY family transcriptional regulator [Lachnospiraceae bacterium]